MDGFMWMISLFVSIRTSMSTFFGETTREYNIWMDGSQIDGATQSKLGLEEKGSCSGVG